MLINGPGVQENTDDEINKSPFSSKLILFIAPPCPLITWHFVIYLLSQILIVRSSPPDTKY